MLDACSAILVSGSDLLKHWRVTHILDVCSAILVIGSDLLKHWRMTHILDTSLAILVSGSSAKCVNPGLALPSEPIIVGLARPNIVM